jgi:Domain of unknown function (DUF6378)
MGDREQAAMKVERLLEQTASIVRERRRTYGQPRELFERVAIRWSQVLDTTMAPAQVIVCLIDLKVAGLVNDSRHLDSITDIAGYAGILAELLDDA